MRYQHLRVAKPRARTFLLGYLVALLVQAIADSYACRIGGMLGIKRLGAGDKVAYEQFLHDQTEFTNLASILPGLYREFGRRDGQGVPS